MQNTSISPPDAVVISTAAQARSDDTSSAQAATAAASPLADNSAIATGQSVPAVSQGARRLVDIFA